MVGVAQDQACLKIVKQDGLRNGFDARLRSHGHENRRFDRAVGGMQNPRSGSCFRAFRRDLKRNVTFHNPLSNVARKLRLVR